MTLLPDDFLQDDNFSQFWKEPSEPGAVDNAYQLDLPFEDAFGTLCPQDAALSSLFMSDLDTGSWNPDEFNETSTSEGTTRMGQNGRTQSGLSSSTGSSFSTTPSVQAGRSQFVDIPLKNTETNGAQWEHIENLELEPDPEELMRRRSLDSLRAEPAVNTSREALTNNRSKSTTEAELLKPRRRRGRKPSNLSPEEKRRRRLERGRLAANKCRRKKRDLEHMLEKRAKDLMAERNQMLTENTELRIEMQRLLEEIMQHSKAACGGIPEAADLLASVPEFPPLPHGPSFTNLEQTIGGFHPTLTYLTSPPMPESGTNYALDNLDLDPATSGDMMDVILPGEI